MGLFDAECRRGLRQQPDDGRRHGRRSARALVFVGAYLLEKTPGPAPLRGRVRLLAMLPMAVPGLVLGLGYIFFFNEPANPLNGLYHTHGAADAVHHRATSTPPATSTAVTALKALDARVRGGGRRR
jgi:ABC-type Fe3+ transport system permease subunit